VERKALSQKMGDKKQDIREVRGTETMGYLAMDRSRAGWGPEGASSQDGLVTYCVLYQNLYKVTRRVVYVGYAYVTFGSEGTLSKQYACG